MKLDFSKMDIGTFQFNFVRTLMVAPTGGADVSECLKAAATIKDNDEGGWVQEWVSIAENVAQVAEQAMQSGQTITARQAYMGQVIIIGPPCSLCPIRTIVSIGT